MHFPGFEEGPNWYAVYTRRQKEHVTDVKLLQIGLETFLPQSCRRFRGKTLIRPLFPCYFFVRFDPARWLYTVNHTPGVNRVVSFDDRPIPVDPAIITSIREQLNDQGFLVEERAFKPGDPVRITMGAFEGQTGVITALRPRDRVVVLLNAIFSRASLVVGADVLELIREYTPTR
ncbi:MAG: hypothetical protein KA419_04250 [Acidobacteria bacterium]|nr:hypothetical protein [Acidobacteriota bacterium]